MHEVPLSKLDLRQLPVFEPDPALWSRIAQTHLRRRRWRQYGMAAAATVLIGVGAALLPRPSTGPEAPRWAEAQHESQVLEAEWRRLADGGRPTTVGLTRLRSIDGALQAAYDRGADADEIAPLWQQRNAALRDLIVRFQDASANDAALVTRI